MIISKKVRVYPKDEKQHRRIELLFYISNTIYNDFVRLVRVLPLPELYNGNDLEKMKKGRKVSWKYKILDIGAMKFDAEEYKNKIDYKHIKNANATIKEFKDLYKIDSSFIRCILLDVAQARKKTSLIHTRKSEEHCSYGSASGHTSNISIVDGEGKNDTLVLYGARFNINKKYTDEIKNKIDSKALPVWRLKRSGKKYFFTFPTDETYKYDDSDNKIGLDLSMGDTIAHTSEGKHLEVPKKVWYLRKVAEKTQGMADRGNRSKKKRLSAKTRKLQRKEKNIMDTFRHQITADIVKNNGYIAMEDIKVGQISPSKIKAHKKGKNHRNVSRKFNKKIRQIGWFDFVNKLEYKSKLNNRKFVKVNPKFTSQICFECGYKNEEWALKNSKGIKNVECKGCGVKVHRDINAAKNIRDKAF